MTADCCSLLSATPTSTTTPSAAAAAWPGRNCAEILLGAARCAGLRREGCFFVMPEWSGRWREVFATELDLDQKTAHELMSEFHTTLLDLDPGRMAVPTAELEAMSAYVNLPFEVMAVGPAPLLVAIAESLERIGGHDQ